MLRISKKQQAINFIESGNLKKAWELLRRFHLDFSKDEQRALQIGYDCEYIDGRTEFYESLDICTGSMIGTAKYLIDEWYQKKTYKTPIL